MSPVTTHTTCPACDLGTCTDHLDLDQTITVLQNIKKHQGNLNSLTLNIDNNTYKLRGISTERFMINLDLE